MTMPVQVLAAATAADWPQRLALTLFMGALVLAFLVLMRRGWVRRASRQSDVSPLPPVPPVPSVGDAEGGAVADASGRYLGATRSGDWLDRVAVHGLGVPSKAHCVVSERGVWIVRQGATNVFIAAGDVAGVRHDRASAGRVLEVDGVLLITWDHDGALIDIGLRVPDAATAELLRVGIMQTMSTSSQGEPA